MSKVFLQKLRMVASEADDLLSSCDASDLLDGLEVARDFMFEAASMIEELESRLAQAERERDAMLTDIPIASMHLCNVCKHDAWPQCAKTGKLNIDTDDIVACDHFEWRGVCEENTKEDTKE